MATYGTPSAGGSAIVAERRHHCFVCRQERSWSHWHREIYRCLACGMVSCLTVPSSEQVTSIYSEGYFRGVEYCDYQEVSQGIRRTLARRLQDVRLAGATGGRLLEVGCAYGYFLDLCRHDFAQIIGVDVSQHAVQCARESLGVDARSGQLADLSLPDGWASTVCVWDTVEHLVDPARTILEIARIMADRGWLFLTTGDVGSWVARVRGRRWRQIHPPTHLHYFSRFTIAALLRDAGFEDLTIRSVANVHRLDSVLHNLKLRRNPIGHLSRLVANWNWLARREIVIDLCDIMLVSARRKAREPRAPSQARA